MNVGSSPGAASALPDAERIVLLDVLRGVALMGILVMNLPTFTAADTAPPHSLDHLAEVLRDMLFAGKFNSIFSLLFGLGFTLQLARLQARVPEQAVAIYCRRLGWLLAIGLVHEVLLWNGDVLHMYALLGFGLLWMRRWSDRALLGLMALCVLAPALSQLVRALLASQAGHAAAAPLAAVVATGWSDAELQAFGHGSLLDVVRMNVHGFVSTYTQLGELRNHLGLVAQVLTTMTLGLLIGRHGWVHQLPQRMPQVLRLQRWSLGLALVSVGIYALGHDLAPSAEAPVRALVGTAYVIARLGLMAFYVLTLVRLMENPAWRRRLGPFAAAGRMPLTNYLAQTVICSVLFQGWGFGLWDQVGVAMEIPIALAIFLAVQMPLSMWWLRHHDQGPLERLWRRATYGRAGPSGGVAARPK